MRKTVWTLAMAPLLLMGADLYMAGDSTLHSRKYVTAQHPETERCLGSWGDELENYVKPGVKVVDLAMSGCSTKSFIDQNRWAGLIAQVKPGDYVFIQFGHNDQKKNNPKVYAPAAGAYSDNIRRFVKEVRDKGGKPVLGTSMVRRFLGRDGKVNDGLEDYPETTRRLGKELGVPVVDMNAFTRKLVESTPQEETRLWYRASIDGKDWTHPTKLGAKVFAKAFVEDVKDNKLDLVEIFK
ncbi:MAG: rhamnogalacturonan acetylesterase [Kiritimatiellae bacterium]|nr:rhamnogalacturonan acetylesterase [Kiritimatiellia bacterium]